MTGRAGGLITDGAGNDSVSTVARETTRSNGAPGNDTLYERTRKARFQRRPGADRIFGGPGNDHHPRRRRRQGTIDCGTGTRCRLRDKHDKIAKKCEVVRR